MLNSQFGKERLQFSFDKLSPVIYYDRMGDAKPTYNFSREALYIGGHNLGKGLNLYPLGEIIN